MYDSTGNKLLLKKTNNQWRAEKQLLLAERCFWPSWQIIPTHIGALMSDNEKGQRVMQVLLQMKKPDIAALKNA